MRKFIWLILVLVYSDSFAQNGWVNQFTKNRHIGGAYFVNLNTCWLIGDSVWKSTDGGNSWNTQILPQASQFSGGAFFLNEHTGWTNSSLGGGVTSPINFMKTTNGGTNWFSVNSSQQTYGYNGGYAFTENTFYISTGSYISNPIGGPGIHYGAVLKTTNGGTTYSEQFYNGSYNYSFDKITFLNANTGWAVITYNSTLTHKIVKTTNGGANWNQLNTDTAITGIREFQFLNESTGYLMAFRPLDGVVYKTINGGNNWQILTMHDSINDGPRHIHFLNSVTGWVSGRNFSLAKTTDGGNSWAYNQINPYYGAQYGIKFLNENTGWMWGSNGSQFVLYKTTTGGITFITQTSSNIPGNFSLSQNYPNPFNPSTNINYQLPISNYVTLKVYDALGNEVATLVNEKQNAGSYSVDFNAASHSGSHSGSYSGSLASGIYFYKLVTEKFSETKKMILVK